MPKNGIPFLLWGGVMLNKIINPAAGERKTYPERPCRKCGNVHSDRQCKICVRSTGKAYRLKNPRKSSAEEPRKHGDYDSVAAKLRYQQNREEICAIRAKWRSDNKEKIRIKNAKYALENPEKRRVISHNRRARLRADGGRLSPDLASRLMKLQKGRCACCGLDLGTGYHLDHINPIAKGGLNVDENIQLLRSDCNLRKGVKDPIAHMQARGFLI